MKSVVGYTTRMATIYEMLSNKASPCKACTIIVLCTLSNEKFLTLQKHVPQIISLISYYHTPIVNLYKNNSKNKIENLKFYFLKKSYGEIKNLRKYLQNLTSDQFKSSKKKLFIKACTKWLSK